MENIGSFKDPQGQVKILKESILRTCNDQFKESVDEFLKSNLYFQLVNAEMIHPASWDQNREFIIQNRITPWIYPYEWSFEMLKSAALQTLKIQKTALLNGYTLKDASAFNIAFVNFKPVHIDLYSFVNFVPQLAWDGLDQFYREFINPLLLQGEIGIYFQDYYKAKLNGITTADLNSAIKGLNKLKPLVFSLVTRKAAIDSFCKKRGEPLVTKNVIPEKLLLNLQIKNIDKLTKLVSKIKKHNSSEWSNYRKTRIYKIDEIANKIKVAEEFLIKYSPKSLIDYGCNDGEFSFLASGYTDDVLAIDLDADCIDLIYQRLSTSNHGSKINIAVQDLSNPSPDLGWQNYERSSFLKRSNNYQAFFALALVHHLRISANIPTKMFLNFFATRHSFGLLEYVSPEDPMILDMLKSRNGFDLSDYFYSEFKDSCKEFFEIIEEVKVSETRILIYLKSLVCENKK